MVASVPVATSSEPNRELLLTKPAKRRLGSRIPAFGRQGQQEEVAVRGVVAGRPLVRYAVRMSIPALNLHDDIQPVSDFRANTAATLRRLRESGRPLVLTQNGRSAAVLLDVGTYQALLDENDLLRDLQAGLLDAREGRVTAHADARAELLGRYRA